MILDRSVADAREIAPSPPDGAPPPARIIAVNRFYWPDHAATGQILTDLTTFLASRGWSVGVITSRLRYDGSEAALAPREVRDGVAVRRVWTSRMGRARLPGRLLDYLTFYVSAAAALLVEAKRGDVVIVTTDPPLFLLIAAPLTRLKRARLVTWNHDVFPEVAGALGLGWADGPIGRILARLRNRALRGAAINVALSGAMADRLARSVAGEAHLRVVPNWSDGGIRPVAPEDNRLRRDWGLGNAFVIGYSGNLGRAHMPNKVGELVRRTLDLPDVVWLFIGGGIGMGCIRAIAAQTEAAKLQIHPYQPRKDLAQSLSAPDLHLVSLDPACEGLIVPSKISGILAAGRPLLYLGNPESALAREIAERGTGLCLDPAAPETWRQKIAAVRADPTRLRDMGRRARKSSEASSPRKMLPAWQAILAEAVGGSQGKAY